MRVRVQRPCTKTIIMHIHENNAHSLATMDQDADSVWAMTLNCLGHKNWQNNAYILIIENMHYCDSDTNE